MKTLTKKNHKPQVCVWDGPCAPGPKGGITQSMIGRYLCCKERFRLTVMEGLRPHSGWTHKFGYGDMWHVCEEHLKEGMANAFDHLKLLAKKLCRAYPLDQEHIVHWYNVCKIQFPIYVEFWAKRKKSKHKKIISREVTFDVPYELPSGRVVRMRGKWDGIAIDGKGKNKGLWLDEHKTKGDIDQQALVRQLTFDLQTMYYEVALREAIRQAKEGQYALEGAFVQAINLPLRGVCYNTIRRPLAGGKYSIKRKEPSRSNLNGETPEEFYARLGGLIAADPEFFFMRWDVAVTRGDIDKFEREFLIPCLEEICRWWDLVTGEDVFGVVHYRLPYGVYNPLMDGRPSEIDEYLNSGSTLGLDRGVPLFQELTTTT